MTASMRITIAVERRHWSSDIKLLAYLFIVRHNSDSSVLSRHLLSRLLSLFLSLWSGCFSIRFLLKGASELDAADDGAEVPGVSMSVNVGVVVAPAGDSGIGITSSFFDILTGSKLPCGFN